MKKDGRIKDLPEIERPREKLLQYGPEKLSVSELLAIVLRNGRKDENVIALSDRILRQFNGKGLQNITVKELSGLQGVGPAKACEIVACLELGKRLLKDKKNHIILKPEDIYFRLSEFREKKKEYFFVFYLDTRNQEIVRELISVGLLNASLIHPREVFEPAVRNLAASIIIAHNHPSGNPEPSEEDLKITARLQKAGEILGIGISDHVIVAKDSFFSFTEKGLI